MLPSKLTQPLSSALQTGAYALDRSIQRLDSDAQQIADPQQIAPGPLLDLQQAKLSAEAAIQVVKTSNQVLGKLLDVLA